MNVCYFTLLTLILSLLSLNYLFDIWNTVSKNFHMFLAPAVVVVWLLHYINTLIQEKGKRKVQGGPQLQTAALLRPQEEEETDKSKQAQIEQTYEKH